MLLTLLKFDVSLKHKIFYILKKVLQCEPIPLQLVRKVLLHLSIPLQIFNSIKEHFNIP